MRRRLSLYLYRLQNRRVLMHWRNCFWWILSWRFCHRHFYQRHRKFSGQQCLSIFLGILEWLLGTQVQDVFPIRLTVIKRLSVLLFIKGFKSSVSMYSLLTFLRILKHLTTGVRSAYSFFQTFKKAVLVIFPFLSLSTLAKAIELRNLGIWKTLTVIGSNWVT